MSDNARAVMSQMRALTRFKWRAGYRQALYNVTHSAQGFLVVILAGFALASVATSFASPSPGARLEPARQATALLLAHAAIVAGAICGVIAMLCRDFTIGRRSEPLASSPAVLPALLAYHVLVEALLIVALQLLAFFYFFNGRALWHSLGRPWIALPVHVVAEVGTVLVAGLVGAWLFRRLLLGRRFLARARVAYQISVLGMLFGIAGPLLLPAAVARFAPELLDSHTNAGLAIVRTLNPAFAAAQAASEGRIVTMVMWLGAVAGAVWVAMRLFARWLPAGPREIAVDSDEPSERRYGSAFASIDRSASASAWPVRAFWRKDYLCAHGRVPGGLVGRHAMIAAGALAVAVMSVVLELRAAVPARTTVALLPAIAAGVAAALAGKGGLASLGMEGRNLVLLRTAMPARVLFLSKLIPNAAYAAVCSILYAIALLLIGLPTGVRSGAAAGVIVAGAQWAVVYALFANALGFLLPALATQNTRGSGASVAARWLYTTIAGYGVVTLAITGVLTSNQAAGATLVVVVNLVWLSIVFAAGVGLAALSIKRLPLREL